MTMKLENVSMRIELKAGCYIDNALQEMLEVANRLRVPCQTMFNERLIIVCPDDDLEKLIEIGKTKYPLVSSKIL